MVSIVANLYNSSKYIPKLMRSVAQQTYTDWELICVNDCSPGDDAKVVERIARQLNIADKVRIINNITNLGIARAKKVGIDQAKGEFITFIDGDDWLALQAVEKLVSPMIDHNLDMAIFNHYRYYTPFYKTSQKCNVEAGHWDEPLSREVFCEYYLENFITENRYGVAYWGKMYRTSILKNLDFEYPDAEHSVREDFLFSMAVAEVVNRVMFVDYTGYYWRYGGITTGNRSNEDWSLQKYVIQNADMYSKRNAFAMNYSLESALSSLSAQLKNLLLWSVSRMAKYPTDSPSSESLKMFIAEILNMPAYDKSNFEILLANHPSEKNEYIIDLICRKDVESLYSMCHETYNKNKTKNTLRLIALKLLTPFMK